MEFYYDCFIGAPPSSKPTDTIQMAARLNSISTLDDLMIEPCKDDEESTLLLNTSFRRKRRSWYTCKWIIKTKGTVIILIWLALVQSFDPVVAISMAGLGNERKDKLFLIYTCCSFLFYLLFPVVGLYADIKFGRHRISQVAIVLSILCTVMVGIGAGLAETINSVVNLVVFSVGLIVGNLAQTAFVIVMASYGFEQLDTAGASSEELSAYAHWFYWCRIFGWFVTVPVTCSMDIKYGAVIVYSLHISFLLVVFGSSWFSKRLGIIETRPPVNPLNQMIKVIRYARKNKYTRNRSALTYWEESSPSRLDLGKEKYGGPFTEGEVEDVKTFLKMLPLICCMVFFVIIMDQFNPYYFMIERHEKGFIENCLISSVYFVNSVTILVTMFTYQVLKPLFDQCLPTMLRRIGLGIFLVLMAETMWLCMDVAGHFSSEDRNTTCLFKLPSNDTVGPVHWNINHMWILAPKISMGIAFGIAIPTTLEFVFAQAPHSMKGLVIGVWFMAAGSIKMVGFDMQYPFRLLDGLWPNCSFYYYITKIVLVGLSFVFFIILTMWYKPRQRELLYNSHITVENFYEKDFIRREEYEVEKRRRKLGGFVERDVATIDINEYLSSLYKGRLN